MLYGILSGDVLARTLEELAKRTGVHKVEVEDIVWGIVAADGEQGANVARMAGVLVGFPQTVPGVQVNRMCGSSKHAIHFAAQAIAAGDVDVGIGCGVEMMSTV
eukprot:EC713031.1.p2 GENE.EC713031.1~~EC713031.1.p2  ORF type:complete len:104 (+),score=9.38 EC713031.1:50-361(+)